MVRLIEPTKRKIPTEANATKTETPVENTSAPKNENSDKPNPTETAIAESERTRTFVMNITNWPTKKRKVMIPAKTKKTLNTLEISSGIYTTRLSSKIEKFCLV